MLAYAGTGKTKVILTERDAAWVDVNDEMFWTDDAQHFTWISQRDGWRHAYLADRSSLDLNSTVTVEGWVYVDSFKEVYAGLFGKPGRNYTLFLQNDGRLHFSYFNTSGKNNNLAIVA